MKHLNNLGLILLLLTVGSYALNAQSDGDLPPDAVPGKCYANCMIPDEYETVTDEILVKEASSRLEIIPAQYGTESEELLTKEAYTVYNIVPPAYTTVTEEVMIKEASSRLEYVPPTYETVSEQMLVSPASTRWVKGKPDPNCVSENPDDCRVMCLKEVQAQYRTVTKQVLKTPATTREIPIPADFKTVTKTVVETPAQVVEKTIPAEYRTLTRQIVTAPASTSEIPIPAEYKTVSSRRLVNVGGFTTWREVLCGAKLSGATIMAIQRALRAKGYDIGPSGIDDVLGSYTKAAIIQFQKDSNLAVGVQGNNVPLETLKALGVK